MMLGHAQAESALESSGLAARDGIALLPSECLGAFPQHLHRGHRFVRMERVTRSQLRHVHHAVLHGIDAKGVGHFVDHVFPGPLRFLLDVAAGRTGAWRVRAIGGPRRSPVRNFCRVQLGLIGRVARTVGVHAEIQVANAYVYFVVESNDAAVFLCAHSELGDGLRLDLQLRQFLILGQHDLYRSASDFRQMGDHRIKSLRRHARRAERATVPFVDHADFGNVHAERRRKSRPHGINALAHAPHGQFVAVPFGDAAARLHRHGNAARKAVAEFLDHVRFGESSFDVAMLIRPGYVRKIRGRKRMADEVPFSMSQIGRIRQPCCPSAARRMAARRTLP